MTSKFMNIFIVSLMIILQVGCNNTKVQNDNPVKIKSIKIDKEYISKKKNLQLIATSETPLYEQNTTRRDNIELASNAINNIILAPNQEFSFNEIVGERTTKKGYKEAPILIRTENGTQKGMGVGGGICQVASTIYKTAKNAELEILERHPHSKKVFYTNIGDDATVAYPSTDLRFKNNRKNEIVIKVELEKDKLRVDILENI